VVLYAEETILGLIMAKMSIKHFYRLQMTMGLGSRLLPQVELASIILERNNYNQPKEMTKKIAKNIIIQHMNKLGILVNRKIGKVVNGTCYVYVIQQQGGDWHVKIGKAKDVENRLKSLQTSSPYDLKIMVKICATDETHALNMEKGLHERLKKHKVRGEWFSKSVINIIPSVLEA